MDEPVSKSLLRYGLAQTRAAQGLSCKRTDNVFSAQEPAIPTPTKPVVSTLTGAAYGSPHAASRNHDANATIPLERVRHEVQHVRLRREGARQGDQVSKASLDPVILPHSVSPAQVLAIPPGGCLKRRPDTVPASTRTHTNTHLPRSPGETVKNKIKWFGRVQPLLRQSDV